VSEIKFPQTSKDNNQIVNASVIVMAGFVLSNLVGLVRQMLITNAFGTTAAIDAYYAAEGLPNTLFMLVAGGALASAFIPTFTGLIASKQLEKGWKFASAIINWILVLLVSASVLSFIFAEPLISNLIAPKYTGDQLALTVELFRILLLTTVVFGVSGLLMGILNAHQSFVYPALAPTMYWLGMIFGVLVLSPQIGVQGLAWGAVLGSVLHLLVQVPGILKLPQFKFHLSLGHGIKEVKEVALLMLPRLFGVGIVQINGLVNRVVASGLKNVGSITAITTSFQVMTMPQVVIAQSISIAAMPTFSAQIARGRKDEMRQSLAGVIRGILILSIPATVGLILLRKEIISFMFERGAFGPESVMLTAWALLWYTIGLVGHSLVEILSRAFYALKDTKTPVTVGIGAMSLNILLSFWLPSVFASIGWLPLGGIPLANTIATSLEMVILIILIRKRLAGMNAGYILKGLIPSLISALLMALGLLYWMSIFSTSSMWIVVVGGILVGGVIYILSLWLLKTPEVINLFDFVAAKMKNIMRRYGK
jgi:putative peptidoglycan lipid II flippase